MNAMLEPRIVAAKIHGPFIAAGWEHRILRIAASSQGGLAIVAIRPFSTGSLRVGSQRDVARKHWRTSAFIGRCQALMRCGYCIHSDQGGDNPSRYLFPITTIRV